MKIAVILFNLGGPDSSAAVKPFLFNLFNDAAIIRLPQPLRYLIASLIAAKRTPVAQDIYGKIGGRSPILENTKAQANALEKMLNAPLSTGHANESDGPISLTKKGLAGFAGRKEMLAGENFRCFIAMRYWRPFADATVAEVAKFAPDKIILLPLYPQFSTTTTASSLKGWRKAARKIGLNAPAKMICCYPVEKGFISALAASAREAHEKAQAYGKPRVLFSAHGLPEKIVQAGDPYQAQCELTVQALIRSMNIIGLDHTLCYQSRVGPLKWIGPATDDEIRRAGKDRVSLVVVPIAFVSEHSETLVELDIEYLHLAKDAGVPFYIRVPTVGIAPDFIAGLAALVQKSFAAEGDCISEAGGRICPAQFSGCGFCQ